MFQNIVTRHIYNMQVLLEPKYPSLTVICLTCFTNSIQTSMSVSPLFCYLYPTPNTFSPLLAFYFMVRG